MRPSDTGGVKGWGNTEFQVVMSSDTVGLSEGCLLSIFKILSLNASVPKHPAEQSKHWHWGSTEKSISGNERGQNTE